MSLVRCVMSTAVIGSPPTIATTWACARGGLVRSNAPATPSIAAIPHAEALVVSKTCPMWSARIVIATKGIISDLLSVAPPFMRLEQAAGARRVGALTETRAADRAQIDHQQDLIIGRRGAAVSIIREVIERNGEAIVNISKPDPGLVDLMGFEIVASR